MDFYHSISFFGVAFVLTGLWNLLVWLPRIPVFMKSFVLLGINIFFLYNLAGFRDYQLVFILSLAVFAFAIALLTSFIRKKVPSLGIVPAVLCIASVVFFIGFLCVFKYQKVAQLVMPLFPANIIYDEGDLSRRLIRFIGISYAAFKLLQIVIDANRGLIKNLSFLSTLNFISFFPVFLSGPIMRYNTFDDSIQGLKRHSFKAEWPGGLYRIATGIIKTLLLSPFLYELSISNIPDSVILHMSWYKILLVMYAYGFYIYLDFSGYCDLAIGFGALMGFRVPENFSNPFLSRNIQEFWNRWHITLSQWFRDYFFYPLLKWQMKVVKKRTVVLPASAIFLTFVLMGIWHDITLTNLWYGIYHGAGLAFFMVFNEKVKVTKAGAWMRTSRIWNVCAVLITVHFCFVSFLVFSGKFVPFARAMLRL